MSDLFDKTQSGNTLFQNLNTLEGRVAELEENGTPSASGVTNDVPLTLGEFYVVRKAREAIEATAYLTAALNVPDDSPQVAGDMITGVPYSSTKKWNTFVPNHVSFETYFTAMSDPNSYAYTVHPHSGAREYLYYGLVCTEFACHCLGIKPIIHTNWEIFDVPGMELVSTQDAQAAHIGYLLNSEGRGNRHHVMVIIGVTRTNGTVTSVTIGESTVPFARAMEYTAEEFNTMLSTTYTMLKYNKLEENTYEPLMSPYRMPYFNRNIMPKKGNKANWSNNENVIIDVLDAGDYTDYIVYKDGAQYSTASFSGTTIDLGVLPWGKYKMVLTDGTNMSGAVEWIVVDKHMSVEARSGGILRFTFSSKNAVPIACCWATPSNCMMFPTWKVNKEDITKGYKDTKLSTEPSCVYNVAYYSDRKTQSQTWNKDYKGNGKIRPRMLFETEFGIITTDWGTSSDDITYIA